VSDMDVEPDPIIRTALQRLPIPAHSDEFWSRLAGSIDAEGALLTDGRKVLVEAPEAVPGDGRPAATVGEPDPALALVPKALRRTSNGVLLAVAAAAAVVVTLAGTALIEDRTGSNEIASDDITESAATLQDKVEDDAPVTLSEDGVDASSEAVMDWVEDLDAGDGAGAWQALGTASQAHFGTQEAFESEMTALAEGYADWTEATPEEVLVTPVHTDDDGTIAVVTLVGTIVTEGAAERRTDAFPVRVVDGEAVVEPFALAGAIEHVVPEVPVEEDAASAPVESGEALVVVVPAGAEAPILRLDEDEAVVCGHAEGSELTDLEGTSGQRCSYLPPDGMTSGEHTLTTVVLGSDGESISAESTLFEAA
jgi:hypothetical protein